MSGSSVSRDRGNALKVLFGRAERVLIGVVHLLPLPGSPDYDGTGVTPIYDRALADDGLCDRAEARRRRAYRSDAARSCPPLTRNARERSATR